MAKIKAVAKWDPIIQRNCNTPKGSILLLIDEAYYKTVRETLTRLNDFQMSRGQLRELDLTIDIHYKARTLKQNALMWSLYTIEAKEMNAGQAGTKDQMVTPEELYEQDLNDYAEKKVLIVENDMIPYIRSEYRVIRSKPVTDNTTEMVFIKTTSLMNTRELAEWVDRLFNRLAVNGTPVTNPAELADYWNKWRRYLNDKKVILRNGEQLTGREYKELNPICEATGQYLGNGGGSLAHIKARGMGGNPELEKDTPENWLHLSDPAHALFDNGMGRDIFLKKYPHLTYKVETALKKDIVSKHEERVEMVKDIFDGVEVLS